MLIFFGVHGEKQNNREKDPSGSKVVAMNKLKTALARRIVYSRTRATLPSSRTVIHYQYAALKVSCTPQLLVLEFGGKLWQAFSAMYRIKSHRKFAFQKTANIYSSQQQ